MLLQLFIWVFVILLVLWIVLYIERRYNKIKLTEGFEEVIDPDTEVYVEPPKPEKLPELPHDAVLPSRSQMFEESMAELPQEIVDDVTQSKESATINYKLSADELAKQYGILKESEILAKNNVQEEIAIREVESKLFGKEQPERKTRNRKKEEYDRRKQQLNRLQYPGSYSYSEVPEADDPQIDVSYGLMMTNLEQNAREQCYQDQCEEIRADIEATCAPFKPECMIQNLQDIERCLTSHNIRCDTTRLRECRDKCKTKWNFRGSRSAMLQGGYMESYDKLTSEDGRTVFILQDDGTLELYVDKRRVWTSDTNRPEIGGGADNGPFTLTMHKNGDLVLTNYLDMDVWHSNSWLDSLGGGFMNGPYKFIIKEGNGFVQNKQGRILWKIR